MSVVIKEFYKNVFADFVLRLINSTGGYKARTSVLGQHGCVWKNGKPSYPKQLRRSQDLRMPRWHRLMLNYMNQNRLERMRASGSGKWPAQKRYVGGGFQATQGPSTAPSHPLAFLFIDSAAVVRSGAPRPIPAQE